MQEKKNDFYSPGICQRLFNFIMNGLVARGLKRVTLGQPTVAAGGSMVAQQNKSSSKLNGEVMPVHYLDCENSQDDLHVSFREGLESWIHVGDKFGSSNYGAEKDGAVLHGGKNTTTPVRPQESKDEATEGRKKIGSETPRLKDLQRKGFQYTEPNQIPVSQPRGGTKITTVKDSAEEEKKKSKEKNLEAKDGGAQAVKRTKKGEKANGTSGPSTNNSLILALDEKMQTKTPSPRSIGSFLGNINEQSDEFIRRKKEAMSNTLS